MAKRPDQDSGFFVVLELLAVSVFWHEAVLGEIEDIAMCKSPGPLCQFCKSGFDRILFGFRQGFDAVQGDDRE